MWFSKIICYPCALIFLLDTHLILLTLHIQVSFVVIQHYEPPVLACALNEVLTKIAGDDSSLMPTLLVLFLVESSKVKGQSKSLRSDESKASIFGMQIGQNTDIMHALIKKTQEPPSSLRIQHETFACFLHFVRVMKLPTFFLIGQTSEYLDSKSTKQHEVFILLITFKAYCLIWLPLKMFVIWTMVGLNGVSSDNLPLK